MPKFYPAPKDVIEMFEEQIADRHATLLDAKIGILMRDECPVSNGRVTLGDVKKVSPTERALMPYDLIVWVGEDMFYSLTPAQQVALIDHLLIQYKLEPGDPPVLRKVQPDITEYNQIIAWHGFWWPGAQHTQQAISQMPLPFGRETRRGSVEAAQLPAGAELDTLPA